MIVTCENCHTRYLVPNYALGDEGRRVRCVKCEHEWYQEPEFAEDEEEFDGDDGSEGEWLVGDRFETEEDKDLDPIPQSVRPLPEESHVPILHEEGEHRENLRARLFGYGAAAAVLILIMGGLLWAHEPVMGRWPATAAFYELVGITPPVSGGDLILDRIEAVAVSHEEGGNVLNVRGKIINLRNRPAHVPDIRASLKVGENEIFTSWVIKPPDKEIKPEGDIIFESSYPEVPREIKELSLRFIPGS